MCQNATLLEITCHGSLCLYTFVLQVYLAHTEDVGADVAHCGYLVHHKIYSETDHSDLTEPTECFTDYLIPGIILIV